MSEVRSGRSPSPRGQRVVVLHGSSLMAQGLEALLGNSPSIDVVSIDLREPDAWERLRMAAPTTVLAESAGIEQGGWQALWRLLEERRDLSIILVHSDEDAVSIYRKHLMAIHDSEDLVSAIIGTLARS